MKVSISKKKASLLVALVIVLVSSLKLFTDWANEPASEIIHSAQQTPPPPESHFNKAITTKFFKTTVPEHYHIQITQPENQPEIIHVLSFDPHNKEAQIGIISGPLPAEGISGVGEYNYRYTMPGRYTRITLLEKTAPTTAFMLADGTELTLFLVDGGRYAAVSLTQTGTNQDALVMRGQALIESWTWL